METIRLLVEITLAFILPIWLSPNWEPTTKPAGEASDLAEE
jgi:hypothetical protein